MAPEFRRLLKLIIAVAVPGIALSIWAATLPPHDHVRRLLLLLALVWYGIGLLLCILGLAQSIRDYRRFMALLRADRTAALDDDLDEFNAWLRAADDDLLDSLDAAMDTEAGLQRTKRDVCDDEVLHGPHEWYGTPATFRRECPGRLAAGDGGQG